MVQKENLADKKEEISLVCKLYPLLFFVINSNRALIKI